MKKIATYITMLLAVLAVASCSSDDAPADAFGQPITVRVKLDAAANTVGTRATWKDANATDGEMMKSWMVVAVQDGKVAAIAESDYGSAEKEEDEVDMALLTGSVTFYSFANLTKSQVGLEGVSEGDALPADFDSRTIALEGNKDGIADFAQGIPMSNKQTFTITDDYRNADKTVDLEVVRLVAKAEIRLTNITSKDMAVKSVSLNDVTADGSVTSLLPSLDASGKVQPSIADGATRIDRTYAFATAPTVTAGSTSPVVATFYLNESQSLKPHYFVLAVTMADGSLQRFAMLSWNSIARNDYLVIPVQLNDYKVSMDVEQFTAIGVLPEVVNEEGKLTVTFRTYGEFHLRPHVIRLSANTELAVGKDCTMADWKTIEQDATGGDGVSIYDSAPAFDSGSGLFEGVMGFREGYAIHQLALTIGNVTIPYQVEVRMAK